VRKYVVISAAATPLTYMVITHFLARLFVGVTIWVATFFRDPVRTTPRGDKLIVAPADGLITMIARVPPPPELRGGDGLPDGVCTRV
jgi:phosphatidylserine decarboxylase